MAIEMIDCPACGASVSSESASCPKCGHPLQGSGSGDQLVAKKKKKKKFVHAGCLIYLVGWGIAGLLVAFLDVPVSGEDGMTYGGILAIAVFIGSILAGMPLGKDWLCGNCGTKLTSKSVKICPACKARFEK